MKYFIILLASTFFLGCKDNSELIAENKKLKEVIKNHEEVIKRNSLFYKFKYIKPKIIPGSKKK